jgi:hypothetical protein
MGFDWPVRVRRSCRGACSRPPTIDAPAQFRAELQRPPQLAASFISNVTCLPSRLLLLAQMRSADCAEQCPLSGATRKTFAQAEFFSV